MSEHLQTELDTLCIHRKFEHVAAAHPDQIAVVCGSERWSYTRLNQESNRIAHMLIRMGLDHEECVAIAMPRSCEHIAAMLGVLKAGGAYVPLVDNQPVPRLSAMLRDCQARFLIGTKQHLSGLHQQVEFAITLEDTGSDPISNPELPCTPSELAYVMYTSGSTGEPKGVMIEHAGVIRLVHDQWFLPVGHDVNYLCVSSFGFDATTIDVYAALLHGSTLVLTEQRVPEPNELRELIIRENISAVWIAYGFFAAMFEADAEMFKSVKHILTGGERVYAELIRKAQRKLPETEFVTNYGPTECTALTTAMVIEQLGDEASGVLPIGRPLRGMSCAVVRDDGSLANIGEKGELLISGIGILRGYLNSPELSASKIIIDEQGNRTFRSGDLVSLRADGELEFHGRIDSQVKLRGNRFELSEIETVAQQYESVSGCVACIVTEEQKSELVLIATTTSENTSTAELLEYMKATVPEYMIPTRIEWVESIPLTRNGKADRKAAQLIAESIDTVSDSSLDHEVLHTDTERALAALMSEVLSVRVLDRSDRFLNLGGHSLRAVVLCARIRESLGIRLPISAIYTYPTLADLGGHIDNTKESAGTNGSDSISASGKRRSPLSLNQLRLWMIDQISPGDPSYTITIRLDHQGELNQKAFESAWRYICSRHRVLGAHIGIDNGEPELVLDPPASTDCAWKSMAKLGIDDIQQLARRESSRGFSLETGPLARCTAVQSAQKTIVLISMHHIVSDAWSCEILQRELREAYIAYDTGSEPNHSLLPIDFTDYAHWERQLPSTESYQHDLQQWCSWLRGASVVALPKDRSPSSSPSNRGIRVEVPISQDTLTRVHGVAHELGVTPFVYMLTMFNVWLHRLTRERDLVVGVPVANRQQAATQGLIGFFMETLPLRNRVGHADVLRDVVKRIGRNTFEAFDRRDVAFQHIVESLGLHSAYGQNPLFEVFFNHIAVPLSGAPNDSGVLEMNEDEIDNQTAKFDLTCYIFEESANPRIVFNARQSLFSEQTLKWYITQFSAFLQQGVHHLDTKISLIPLDLAPLSPPDPAHVPGPSLPVGVHTHGSIVENIEFVVSRNKGRIAVQTPSQAITYASLWNQSGAIAAQLQSAGLEHGARVLITETDPIEICLSILGVLRAGYTFVPTDAQWPVARLEKIIENTKPSAIIGPCDHALMNDRVVHFDISTLDHSAGDFEPSPIPADLPAYVMFTSGSTGNPKGVVQSHGAVVGHMRTFAHSIRLLPSGSVLQLSSFAFDASIMDMFASWFTGAALCVADPRVDDAQSIHEFIDQQHIDVLHAAPTVFRWLANATPDHITGESIRCVVLGGEQSEVEDLDLIQSCYPNCSLFINGLGLTESSLNMQYRVDPRLPHNWPSRIPIGFPVEGVRARLVDPDGRPTMPTGEIEIQSDRLALSYLCEDQPIGEAKKSSDAQSSDARSWRTGDIATIRHDGSMMHLGREDEQVQVRGCRVEIGELQSAVKTMEHVQEAAVLAQRDVHERVSLVVYVVCDDHVRHDELLAKLARTVPAYMLPQQWIRVREIARVGGGKIDRAGLVRTSPIEFAQERSTPSGPINERIRLIINAFQQVLGIEEVQQHDNFFHLGGNSLRAIQLFNRLQKEIGLDLPISVIYRAPTPKALHDEYEKSLIKTDSPHGLIELRGAEHKHKVIVLPGVGGHPLGFGPLIDRVSSSVRFIGVQYPDEDVLNEIGRTLPDLACWIIEQLDLAGATRTPDMIGYSFGGSLAVEIAMQLQQRGCHPGRVLLLDAHLPFGLPQKSRFGKARVHLARIVEGHEASRIGYITGKLKARSANSNQESPGGAPELDSYRAVSRINRQMVFEYRSVDTYDGDVTLVRARQPDWLRFHHDDGYNGFCKLINPNSIQRIEVDAEHLELFDPGPASQIAKVVDDWLDQPRP